MIMADEPIVLLGCSDTTRRVRRRLRQSAAAAAAAAAPMHTSERQTLRTGRQSPGTKRLVCTFLLLQVVQLQQKAPAG
jgi:hypothetical protein